MNATEVHEGPDIVSSGHVMGTYRMGTDPKQSVVNPDQRAHDHPNLFLLGSGVFPTGSGVEPDADDRRAGAARGRRDSESGVRW